MTPGARLAAAIEVLNRILAGAVAEQALTNWGRGNRFAGSGDRAALRDLVYEALRCKRSFAALGGAETGRGLMLGLARSTGQEALFDGQGHAPPPPEPSEVGAPAEGLAALDCPDWLAPRLQASLGAEFAPVMAAMRHRAPVYLRVNFGQTSPAAVQAELAETGIRTTAHPEVSSALEVTENARKVQTSAAYLEGRVELQDAASQAVVAALPLVSGLRVLDHCAGGGGKALAMAARGGLDLYAHDNEPRRMADLPARAKRAGVRITVLENPERTAPYDLILTDVPCSGSGSWRRDPQGKWALTEERLTALLATQAEILDRAAPMVRQGGTLAYVTCSLLADENEAQVAAFIDRTAGWRLVSERRFSPLSGSDGFYLALLTRET